MLSDSKIRKLKPSKECTPSRPDKYSDQHGNYQHGNYQHGNYQHGNYQNGLATQNVSSIEQGLRKSVTAVS